MRKLKLLMAACALTLGSMTANAREDVTSTYLEDAALENEAGKWGLVSNGGNHAWNADNKYHESWHNTFTLTQTTAALPAGYYQLSVQAAVQDGNSTTISLQATSGSNSSVAAYPKYSTHSSYSDMAAWWAADASHTGNRDLNRIFTTVYVEEGQTLTATFKQTANNQWFVYGQMQLHKLTDAEGRYAQILEAVYNPMTNLDMSGGRYKQRFENYTGGDVSGVIGKRLNKTISSLPNGKYNVTLNGGASYTSGNSGVSGGGASDNKTVFFANNATTNVTVSDRTVIGNSEFTDYTASGGLVTDGNLEIGFENKESGANWFVGSVKYIELAEPYISTIATEIPAATATALTANKWYKFTAASTDNYSFTTTTIDDIICTTTDNLLSEATGTTADATMALTAGTTYYIKSSSAQTLTISPQAFSYTVGEATADVAYIQPGRTVTVSYESLGTDNPSPTLVKDFSSVTFDGKAIDFTATDNGFTFTVPANLIASNDYELRIPASAIGYSDGEGTFNVAQTITLKTPAVFDGVYYMYNTDTKNYLSRSGNWATQSIMDNRGLAVWLEFNGEGKTKIQYFDNLLYVSEGGFCYGDNGTGELFTVTAVEGGYKFLCSSNSKYFAVYNGQAVGDAVEGGNLEGTSNVWALETPAQHEANYSRNANVQVAAATENISALSSFVTKASLEEELSANYIETPITITGVKGAKYETYAAQSATLTEAEYYKETVEDLKPGLYKLSVNAFQRAAWYDWVANAGGARGNIYVYANDAKTQIKSVMEYGANEAYSNNWEKDGKNYPNDDLSAYAALETNNYNNDVYVYIPADEGKETGTLVFGINNPTRQGNGVKNGTWAVYNNFTLTYYQPVETITITSAGYATYCSENALDFSGTGIKAYTATVSSKTVTFHEVEGGKIAGNNGLLLKGEEGIYQVPVTVSTNNPSNDLAGVLEDTSLGAGIFVLMNGAKGVGFYKTTTTFTVGAHTAYLPASAGSRMFIGFDDEEEVTGIRELNSSANKGAIYNMNGVRVEKAKKGLYIQNGKKIVVK